MTSTKIRVIFNCVHSEHYHFELYLTYVNEEFMLINILLIFNYFFKKNYVINYCSMYQCTFSPNSSSFKACMSVIIHIHVSYILRICHVGWFVLIASVLQDPLGQSCHLLLCLRGLLLCSIQQLIQVLYTFKSPVDPYSKQNGWYLRTSIRSTRFLFSQF